MYPLLFSSQMKSFDDSVIGSGYQTGLELMESAAEAVFSVITRQVNQQSRIGIFCGPGNNGGDGLAVLRMLHTAGYDAVGILVSGNYRGDSETEYLQAKEAGCRILNWDEAEGIPFFDFIVDALFGTGLNRNLSDKFSSVVNYINTSQAVVLSIDIPSGICSDSGRIFGCAVKADNTVSFQFGKPGLYLYPGNTHAGKVIIAKITDFSMEQEYPVFLINEETVREKLPKLPANAHKGDNGRVLLLGGCKKYQGAVILASSAMIRSGCGLVYTGVPGRLQSICAAIPQAIICPLEDCGTGEWNQSCCRTSTELFQGKDAVCIGPGMGNIEDGEFIKILLQSKIPAVLDADALNYLSKNRTLLDQLHPKAILTPHIGEMSRLTGISGKEILADRMHICTEYAAKWNCILVLKSDTTVISDGHSTALNITGNPGLAKGGSGDMLCGLIGSMLGQKISPFDSACAGSYLLGAAADSAFRLLQERMLTASDIIGSFGNAIIELSGININSGNATADVQ